MTEHERDSSKDAKRDRQAAATSLLDTISYDTAIPDHKFWPKYAPTYTLGVPAGEMIDQNNEAHFEAISKTFIEHVKMVSASR